MPHRPECEDCGYFIFGECDGVNCTRDCSAKMYRPPERKRDWLFSAIWMPLALVAIFVAVLAWT